MDQKYDRIFPSAPLGKNDLEQRLEKKLNDTNSLINQISNIKEMILYFKDKTINQKRDNKILKL